MKTKAIHPTIKKGDTLHCTKFALADGILEETVSDIFQFSGDVNWHVKLRCDPHLIYRPGRDVHSNRSDAVLKAIKMAEAKLKSLEKIRLKITHHLQGWKKEKTD